MSFIMETLRHFIASKMESPEKRDEFWHKHIRQMEVVTAKKKDDWSQPTKPYGFWKSDKQLAKFNMNKEPGHMSLPGRGSPHGGNPADY
mmetsp:Transcript_9425/g.28345  ORF Transcript_9425/g.28345 Transcript_9425/m.28345 type:complete len:89 (-) Transcript_9425:292-558(-)|eukprot:CAMPEP_0206135484 /NCGR_PEP_ID=MMETSP1473-20131121/759_1 /ASSEMBLY_ACC=CAM_ASM_001109 /TAXON_ID=1461547 /ORGANISM="Stichococcus sp, Strain RCC1054" /LENGTH=88 /DNA_ID=CAMNT_0053527371 /DNA_START=234 /DNA_END=500 /DNA_ORIENTATION=-